MLMHPRREADKFIRVKLKLNWTQVR